MFDVFQRAGKQPVQIETLKRLVMEGAILGAVSFNILAEMPSGLFDFDVSRCTSNH